MYRIRLLLKPYPPLLPSAWGSSTLPPSTRPPSAPEKFAEELLGVLCLVFETVPLCTNIGVKRWWCQIFCDRYGDSNTIPSTACRISIPRRLP
jgi:hypothetical protein